MLTEKLCQAITRISLLTVCLDDSLAGDIMVMICKWYCSSKDVNASAHNVGFLKKGADDQAN